MNKNNAAQQEIERKKIDHIKELLNIESDQRDEKVLLELMSFTKDLKLFESISMSNDHQNICRTLKLVHYKANEKIVRQGEKGNAFYHILSGIVKIIVSKKIDLGLNKSSATENDVTVDKNLGDLKPGQGFGELALIYGTPISATIVAVINCSLIKIEKTEFDMYVKDIFEGQLMDQIDFMKICPIFQKINKENLIKLAIRTERKRYISNQKIIANDTKPDLLYIIRRGNVKVVKKVKFIKNHEGLKKKLFTNPLKYEKNPPFDEDKFIEILSQGPTEEDIKNDNVEDRDIVLESLKMGDVFPVYYVIKYNILDVEFIAESPCELILMKMNDVADTVPEAYEFMTTYAKPYPDIQFVRKFFYLNHSWITFKKNLLKNIKADYTNREIIAKNKMRTNITRRIDVNNLKLPLIFSNKNI